MIKALNKLRIEGKHDKGHPLKNPAGLIFNDERLRAFSLRSEIKK